MSDVGDERRKRLNALKARAAKAKGEEGGIKFRNYQPKDAQLVAAAAEPETEEIVPAGGVEGQEGNLSGSNATRVGDGLLYCLLPVPQFTSVSSGSSTTKNVIQQELSKLQEGQDQDVINIAPKKPDWDLKRDVESKLKKLERRTQRAIADMLREKLAREAEEGSSSGSGSGSEESGSSDEEDE
ncbi:unnamed protein product [Chrysoparadoxa australica]